MRLTDALLGEHGAFYALFDEIEAIAESAGAATQIQSATAVLSALVMSHAAVEETLLFPALEKHLGPAGPLAVMRSEHQEIDRLLDAIVDAGDISEAIALARNALALARDHFRKEEAVLFGLAHKFIGDDELVRLGAAWAKARGVRLT